MTLQNIARIPHHSSAGKQTLPRCTSSHARGRPLIPINRRKFAATLAAVGLTSTPVFADASAVEPEVLHLSRNGWVPNNDRLPVLLYRGAFKLVDGEDAAAVFETAFRRNGWPPQWRNDVYTFHHFHSTAHEILGFAAGHARLILGGEDGHETTVQAGDVAVLPAGTGHCKLSGSEDFLAIGAYPPHQQWDVCRSAPSPDDLDRMLHLPFPDTDPVGGANGPLTRLWKPYA
jgi:uncharacterized protein YjlB